MTPTPQQEAVYSAVAGEPGHIAVEAVAGAGKTTTLVTAVDHARGKAGFVAFNRHIAQELQGRLKGRAKACTLHSLGFSAVRSAWPAVQVDERKPHRLLQTLRPGWFRTTQRGKVIWTDAGRAALDMARLCKLTLTPPTDEALDRLADYYGVDVPEDRGVYDGVGDLLDASAADTATIDFDDMVWFPERHDLQIEQFAVLMVDESQDLSAVQHALVKRASKGGRLIPCGDRKQAIYGFSGSDPESLPRLIASLESDSARGCLSRPLTTTFRCPWAHVNLAKCIVPEIEAAHGAGEGVVAEIEPDEAKASLRPGDLAISRTNAPLVSLAFRLIADGQPARMLGRDIAGGLVALIDRLRPDDLADLKAGVRRWRDREIDKLERREAPDSQILAVEDRAACLSYIAAECESVGEVRERIEGLFTDSEHLSRASTITLASVHRAKGSEADRVFIIDPDKLPLIGKKTKQWQAEQEHNLVYIAVTRAKQALYFAGAMPEMLTSRGPASLVPHLDREDSDA